MCVTVTLLESLLIVLQRTSVTVGMASFPMPAPIAAAELIKPIHGSCRLSWLRRALHIAASWLGPKGTGFTVETIVHRFHCTVDWVPRSVLIAGTGLKLGWLLE